MNGKIAFALALALLAGTPWAASAGYCRNENFVNDVVMPLVGVSFSLMLFLLALFYMAAQFLKKPEYESFVSVELTQLMVSALLIITVFGAAYAACEASVAFAGGDPFQIGGEYLASLNSDYNINTVVGLETVRTFSQYMSSMSFRWGISAWGVAVPGFPSFVVLERFTEFLLMVILPFSASLMVQQVILEVIKGLAVPFILPAGAVLRIFPPTRDAGNFMIAAAIGFQIVYPFSYVMHKEIVDKLKISSGADKDLTQFLKEEGYHNLTPFALADFGLFKLENLILRPLRLITYLMLQAVFLPTLSIILTISASKGLLKFVGQKL